MEHSPATNLLTCILEALGSGVGQPIEYRDWCFSYYCQNVHVTARKNSFISQQFPSTNFLLHPSPITSKFDAVYSEVLTIKKPAILKKIKFLPMFLITSNFLPFKTLQSDDLRKSGGKAPCIFDFRKGSLYTQGQICVFIYCLFYFILFYFCQYMGAKLRQY